MAADAARREVVEKLVRLGMSTAWLSQGKRDPRWFAGEAEAELGRFAAAVERGGWIAVETRLPNIFDTVHVWVKFYEGTDNSYEEVTDSWLQEDGTWAMGSATDLRVTHWRPLPAPPEAAPQV